MNTDKLEAMLIHRIFLVAASLVMTMAAGAQERIAATIDWKGSQDIPGPDGTMVPQLYFTGAQYSLEAPWIPVYSDRIPLPGDVTGCTAWIENPVFGIPDEDLSSSTMFSEIGNKVEVRCSITYDRKKPYLLYSLVPLRTNPYNGNIESLMEFTLVVETQAGDQRSMAKGRDYKSSSVLAAGRWFKFGVQNTGIHRITYADLQAMGLDPASIDPGNIRIYGNGGGILPESLNQSRYDDLEENAILVIGEEDGTFDAQDYIIFYGESPHSWSYNLLNQQFLHSFNIYSDYAYYFLTASLGEGKRITTQAQSPGTPTVTVTRFRDYAFHEVDDNNLINTGRAWFGEVFDVTTDYDFAFSFPGIDPSEPATIKMSVAAKSGMSSTFRVYDQAQQIIAGTVNGIPPTSDTFARTYSGVETFLPSSSDLVLRVVYQKPTQSSIGWLNYLELNVTRALRFPGGQMAFRDPASAVAGNIAEFRLADAGPGVMVWNVTDPLNIAKIATTPSGNDQLFRLATDTLMEFIAYDGSSFYPITFIAEVPNQDLHMDGPHDMVIITHSLFIDQAERLAQYHREQDGMTVLVADVEKVYNEFSSGAQDICAIRDYMKMLYDVAPQGQEPKYLLLFGDASFDYKDRVEGNSNFIPTWEDTESLTIVWSVATDDFYGFLDGSGDELLDIGIGRLPVETHEQAVIAVDKILRYDSHSEEVMEEWRNYISFVADDGDGNLHLSQAEEMAEYLDTNHRQFNVDKIYVDAFEQIATPGGQRTPSVNEAITNRMNKGTLVMNFTGHGGEVGWGHERFLEISDINSWSNTDKLPIFITATCEFSRYDDPERLSAGEMVFRNPDGGAIAMFTTARATFGGSNFNLNTALFNIMFNRTDGELYRFGDLIRLAKNVGGVVENDRKFILLGDPALTLAVPRWNAVVTSINGHAVGEEADTIRALSEVTVTGEIRDFQGNKMTDFNGTIFPIVFDKPAQITTLATDDDSQARTFELQNNILYKGKTQVTAGSYSFTFIVPKDIAYRYGNGKISLYARSENIDANGAYENLIIGGFNEDIDPDDIGPEVSLFMNDETFAFGGITDENPVMLARISDESGINTAGSGIGHDITAILDGATENPIILNDYYEADLDSYTSGTVTFPFFGLSEGLHTISLKVWDVFNNSGEGYIEFVVIGSEQFIIMDGYNYPNPFYEGTYITFAHNQPETELDVQVRIFDLGGRLVKTLSQEMVNPGYHAEPIWWDGRDDGGNNLAKGMYIYRILAKSSTGGTAEDSGKLILLK